MIQKLSWFENHDMCLFIFGLANLFTSQFLGHWPDHWDCIWRSFYVLAYNYLFTQLTLHLQLDAGKLAADDLGQQILQLSRPLQGGMLHELEGTFDSWTLNAEGRSQFRKWLRSPIGEMVNVSVGYYLASRSFKIFIHEVNICLVFSVFLFFLLMWLFLKLYKNKTDGILFLSYSSSSTSLSFPICVLIDRYHRIDKLNQYFLCPN